MSVGSATAAGHGFHPQDNVDDSNATLSGSKVGPQNEDLEGEQMRAEGEGEIMDAQFDKKNAGWGEQGSLTSDLDRQRAEQKGRGRIFRLRREGGRMLMGEWGIGLTMRGSVKHEDWGAEGKRKV
jgi:chromosome condensin MukBEF MukE localization factor